MKKNNIGCLKYIIFAVVMLAFVGYLFANIAPKTCQRAKEEVVERLFDVSIQHDDTVSPNLINDSVTVITTEPNHKIKENVDTTVVTIPIEVTQHSVFVMTKVNGIDVKFTIDTGCSDMQITSAEFFYMKHLGLISENDITDNVTCVYADNSTGDCPVVNLKSLSIGNIELKDIKCTIQENAESSLLLGQNILKKLGEVSIDYENKLLKIKRK